MSEKTERICVDCGFSYIGGPNSKYCRPCVVERRRAKLQAATDWYNQERWLENVRKLLRQHDAWLQSQ